MDFFRRRQEARAEQPSIVEFLRAHQPGPGQAFDESMNLPDQHREPSGLGWAPGSLDNMRWRRFGGPDNSAADRTSRIYAALQGYAARPSPAGLARLEETLNSDPTRDVTMRLIAVVRERPITNRAVGHAGVRSVIESTVHSNVVKLGLILLAGLGDRSDNELLSLIALHGEFTKFAAIAIGMINQDSEPILLTIAPRTTGWGRVAMIEGLLGERSPAANAYLLRHAFDGLMFELGAEVAFLVATECELLYALQADPDEELIRGAGLILQTLAGSPFQNLRDYADGAAATAAWLRAFGPLASTLSDYGIVQSIQDWTETQSAGRWSVEQREEVAALARAIIDDPAWRERVVSGLDDPKTRGHAIGFARRLGIPVRDRLIAWIRESPLQSTWWYWLCDDADDRTIDEVLSLADEVLDVDRIAIGPADQLGLGPGFERDGCVGYVLQALRGVQGLPGRPAKPGFPGKGEKVLLAGLRSRATRNRNLAFATLAAWPQTSMTPALYSALQSAATNEPNEKARELARTVAQQFTRPRTH